MATYAGETVRLKSTITDYDDVPLTDADVTSAGVEIFDADGLLVQTGALTWDALKLYWFYDWDTNGVDAGTYRAKIRFVGATYDTWEVATVRLRTSPV